MTRPVGEKKDEGRGMKDEVIQPSAFGIHPYFLTVIGKRGQALKGVRWMSWHREATKDVVACDKLREAGKRALIRRFPNRETELG
jgi:hypothetical protein